LILYMQCYLQMIRFWNILYCVLWQFCVQWAVSLIKFAVNTKKAI